MSELERRFTTGAVQLRGTADRQLIGGYAAVFNKFSRNLGGFVEQVAPTAFNRSRGNGFPNVVARFNHDDNALLGTIGARTLTLNVDSTGLDYEVDPPKSRADIVELVSRGDVSNSSFAFRMIGDGGDEWGTSDQGYPMRTLLSVELVDVAPVVSPAYPDATAGLRSLAKHKDASFEEVRKLAEKDELRTFFVRTDQKGRIPVVTQGPAARIAILGREKDPWA